MTLIPTCQGHSRSTDPLSCPLTRCHALTVWSPWTQFSRGSPCVSSYHYFFLSGSACYACRTRYCFSKSVRVCLSVRHIVVLYPNECIYHQTLHSLLVAGLVFSVLPLLQNSKGNSLSGSDKYTEVEKIAIFDRNRCLSRKRYEMGPWLLGSQYELGSNDLG